MAAEFAEVTELAGTEISTEQLDRMAHRYHWALQYCRDKDIVEAGCGSGQGLGILGSVARTLEGGDYSSRILSIPQAHYGERVKLSVFDAQRLPFANASKDVVILFEAIYYVPDAAGFARECRRVLRPGGRVLIATANKDLADFNPSPLSHRYYGAVELAELFHGTGFDVRAVRVSASRRGVFAAKGVAACEEARRCARYYAEDDARQTPAQAIRVRQAGADAGGISGERGRAGAAGCAVAAGARPRPQGFVLLRDPTRLNAAQR